MNFGMPYSKEAALLGWLKRSVALYKLAFGHPRQDDPLAFLNGMDVSSPPIDLHELQKGLRPISEIAKD